MSAETQVDFVTHSGNGVTGSGDLAQRLLSSGFNVNALRPNGVLRKDEWIQYDTAIIEVARQRLVLVKDLMSAGLRYPVRNALGKTRVEWERSSDMTPARVSMSGLAESENDTIDFDLTGIPLPIIHKDFNINIRKLAASRETGEALDTTQAEIASRKVAEAMEDLTLNGSTVLGSNNTIYGLRNALNRNTDSLTGNWNAATGENIVSDTLKMIAALVADNMYGPYVMYVAQDAFTHFGADFKDESDRTIMERVSAIPSISSIRALPTLPSGQVIMLQLTRDVVDIVDGMQPTTVQWATRAGFQVNFKVFAIMVPRTKSDKNGQSGIAHFSA